MEDKEKEKEKIALELIVEEMEMIVFRSNVAFRSYFLSEEQKDISQLLFKQFNGSICKNYREYVGKTEFAHNFVQFAKNNSEDWDYLAFIFIPTLLNFYTSLGYHTLFCDFFENVIEKEKVDNKLLKKLILSYVLYDFRFVHDVQQYMFLNSDEKSPIQKAFLESLPRMSIKVQKAFLKYVESNPEEKIKDFIVGDFRTLLISLIGGSKNRVPNLEKEETDDSIIKDISTRLKWGLGQKEYQGISNKSVHVTHILSKYDVNLFNFLKAPATSQKDILREDRLWFIESQKDVYGSKENFKQELFGTLDIEGIYSCQRTFKEKIDAFKVIESQIYDIVVSRFGISKKPEDVLKEIIKEQGLEPKIFNEINFIYKKSSKHYIEDFEFKYERRTSNIFKKHFFNEISKAIVRKYWNSKANNIEAIPEEIANKILDSYDNTEIKSIVNFLEDKNTKRDITTVAAALTDFFDFLGEGYELKSNEDFNNYVVNIFNRSLECSIFKNNYTHQMVIYNRLKQYEDENE